MAFKKGISGNINGRPKGSTTKPRLSSYLTEKQIDALVGKAQEMALAGDSTMLKFVLEQHFGKAIQPVEGDFKATLKVTFDKTFNDK